MVRGQCGGRMRISRTSGVHSGHFPPVVADARDPHRVVSGIQIAGRECSAGASGGCAAVEQNVL